MKPPITTAQAMQHPDVVTTINTLGQIADALRTRLAEVEKDAAPTKVLTEHSGCGHGTQVDRLTVRLNPGDKVVLVMGKYSAAMGAQA